MCMHIECYFPNIYIYIAMQYLKLPWCLMWAVQWVPYPIKWNKVRFIAVYLNHLWPPLTQPSVEALPVSFICFLVDSVTWWRVGYVQNEPIGYDKELVPLIIQLLCMGYFVGASANKSWVKWSYIYTCYQVRLISWLPLNLVRLGSSLPCSIVSRCMPTTEWI